MSEEGTVDGGTNGGDAVTSVGLQDIMDVKGDDGLNFFSDDHREKLKVWGSDDPTKAKFRTTDGKVDVPKLAKSYLDLQGHLHKLAKPLAEDATEQERFEYRKHLQQVLGVPDTPDGYELILPDKLPEGASINQDTVNALKILAHKHNMSRESVQAVFDMHNKVISSMLEAQNKAAVQHNKDVEGKLKAEWGPEEFARYDELIQQYMRDFAGSDEEFDGLFEGLQRTRFEGGPDVKRTVYKMLAKAAELVKGEGQSVYADMEHKMSELDELKKQFPNSWQDMVD